MKLRILAAGAFALVASLVGPATVGAGPVAPSVVAVLANDSYVDMGSMSDGGEVANLVEDLEAGGHTVREFDDISPAGLTAALDGAEVLAIPELENDRDEGGAGQGLVDDLGAEGAAVIQAFVDGGGRILFFGDSDPDPAINGLFGFAVESFEACGAADGDDEEGDWPPCTITAAAANTEFADGAPELFYVNGTTGLLVSSLPAGSTVAYEITVDDGEDDLELESERLSAAAAVQVAGLASMPYGDGAVVFYGWDWFPDSFEGEEEVDGVAATGLGTAGVAEEALWATLLDLGVSQPAVTAAGGTGQLTFTSDSPSTQPVFVEYTIGGTTAIAEIAPGTTSVVVALAGPASAAWSVPGWGVGEGSVEVLGTAVTPTPTPAPAPAAPVVAAPTFTG